MSVQLGGAGEADLERLKMKAAAKAASSVAKQAEKERVALLDAAGKGALELLNE